MPKAVVIATKSAESLIAVKLLEKAKVDYKAVHFDVGLTTDKPIMVGQHISKYRGMKHFIKNRVEIEKFDMARDFYLEVVSRSGYESGPSLDHYVFILKKAKQYMIDCQYDFIVTGDVLDQCPITQTREAFQRIDHEAGVEGLVFRPLSAKLLPKTIAETRFHIHPSIILGYQSNDLGYYACSIEEFDLVDLPSVEVSWQENDITRDEVMGRKAFEVLEKGFTLNTSHLQRLGLHLSIGDAKVVLGRTPFESSYLVLFYKKLLPENATAFSLQDPRYAFGFIYGPHVTKEQIALASRIFVSTLDPIDKSKELSFFDNFYSFFGTKLVEPISFEEYAFYLNKDNRNEMSCPIFTKFSVLPDH